MESVRVGRRDEVVVVTIARPEVRNAVDPATAEALRSAFETFASDDTAVAILTGADGTFCSGFDLRAVAAADSEAVAGDDGPMGPTRMELDKPVIAAVEGFAVGGGFELALWCDLRVAAEDATFGVFNRRFGVPLIDGGTVRLPRLVGQGRALDLILTGRPVTAREGLEMGLVDRLAPSGGALDAALELARTIAGFPQATLRTDRRSVFDQWALSERDALENERGLGLHALASGEAVQGARRFLSQD